MATEFPRYVRVVDGPKTMRWFDRVQTAPQRRMTQKYRQKMSDALYELQGMLREIGLACKAEYIKPYDRNCLVPITVECFSPTAPSYEQAKANDQTISIKIAYSPRRAKGDEITAFVSDTKISTDFAIDDQLREKIIAMTTYRRMPLEIGESSVGDKAPRRPLVKRLIGCLHKSNS